MNQVISIEVLKSAPMHFSGTPDEKNLFLNSTHARTTTYSSAIGNLEDAVRILEPFSDVKANGMAISAIVRAIRALGGPFGIVQKKRSGGLAGWQCAALRHYVSENIQARISVSDLAKTARLSTSHLCRAFRASFDCSPTQFIMRQRVELARRMLFETTMPLSQVAFECGFSDQSHFSRIFHETTGETPWRWRKERKAQASCNASQPTARS